MKKIFLFLFISSLISCDSDNPEEIIPIDQTAIYKIIFDANWTAQTRPTNYPANAHFSLMVGVTHNEQNILFTKGLLASAGIESMAETGATEILTSEIDAKIVSSKALEYKIGNIINGDGIDEITLNASVDFPLFSWVTMLAPSPDWFVANSNIPLIVNNVWVEQIELDVVLFDAGTDSGTDFTSPNDFTNFKEPIFLISEPPLGNGLTVNLAVGKISITKQ
ncbi:MAG: elongation factor Ts [Flavobacteriaceae bacterium]|nr:MAG: elongation factor Ts [Flavobacteriaceae bacterium]